MNIPPLQDQLQRIRDQVARVIIGQDSVVDQALVVLLARQHALLEGVPGVAKTLLVRTLAAVLGRPFQRIQFTPDLMPADITGSHIFNLQRNEFSLSKGPVFTAFLLASEINRAPAKTQSALLQAMQERTVTLDRETHALDPDFTVFATQNPIEFEGTYPLPEAQKDRFLLKIQMDPPARDEEVELARRTLAGEAPEQVLQSGALAPVIAAGELDALRAGLAGVRVKDDLLAYAVDLIRATRAHEGILSGAGPRATQGMLSAARALAALRGRDFATPDDVRELAVPLLAHRIVVRPEFELEGLGAPDAVRQVLSRVAVPT